MSVDIESILAVKIQGLRQEYEAAVRCGDVSRSVACAGQIAESYQQLSEMNTLQSDAYTIHCEQWKQKASQRNVVSATETSDSAQYSENALSMKFCPQVTFADIGGCEELKRELSRAMVSSEIRGMPRVRQTPNVLLFGPPGSGKTLIANALANELRKQSVFYHASLSNLLSKYYGEAPKNISALYENARMSPMKSIIFIDEFDALGRSRGTDDTNGTSRHVVTTLLTEMYGTETMNNPMLQPFTIGACNRPWDVDDALLSRFRKKIFVGLPNAQAASSIVGIQTAGYTLSPELQGDLGRMCVERWYSGRDIEGLCQEAIDVMIDDMNPHFVEEFLDLSESEKEAFRLRMRPLTRDDFEVGFSHIRSPLSQGVMDEYAAWTAEHAR